MYAFPLKAVPHTEAFTEAVQTTLANVGAHPLFLALASRDDDEPPVLFVDIQAANDLHEKRALLLLALEYGGGPPTKLDEKNPAHAEPLAMLAALKAAHDNGVAILGREIAVEELNNLDKPSTH